MPIKLHAILPCREQEKEWSSAHKAIYHEILNAADNVKLLFDGIYDENTKCMWERNIFMVKEAQGIFCYFDGLPYGANFAENIAIERGRGGTRHCLRYPYEHAVATSRSIPIFNYFKAYQTA